MSIRDFIHFIIAQRTAEGQQIAGFILAEHGNFFPLAAVPEGVEPPQGIDFYPVCDQDAMEALATALYSRLLEMALASQPQAA